MPGFTNQHHSQFNSTVSIARFSVVEILLNHDRIAEVML